MAEPPIPPQPLEPIPPRPPSAPQPSGGAPWGKIVLFGCLILLVLGIVIGGIGGFFAYRAYKEKQERQAVRTTGPTPGVTGTTTPAGGTAQTTAVPPGPHQVLTGTIGPGDALRQDGSWYDGYTIELNAGELIVVTMESSDFDAYLSVLSPSGSMTNDDDGGGGTNARVQVTADRGGSWTIMANTLRSGDTGSYTLTVDRQ